MSWVEVPLTEITVASGGVLFTTTGTHSWTVPPGVSKISVVAVGAGGGGDGATYSNDGGGGGGGGLGWKMILL